MKWRKAKKKKSPKWMSRTEEGLNHVRTKGHVADGPKGITISLCFLNFQGSGNSVFIVTGLRLTMLRGH